MKKFIINGKFLADRMCGIVRYGREMLLALDRESNMSGLDITLVIPKNVKDVPKLKNIGILTLGNLTGIPWEQIDLARFIRSNKDYFLINFCNVKPFFTQPGITTIHDVTYKAYPSSYKSLRNKLSRMWHCIQYKYVINSDAVILTVSNFAKREILKYYPEASGKIQVVYNGWQHVHDFSALKTWKKRFPEISDKPFYFSLCTLAEFKNIKWIFEVAKRNLNENFVIAGTYYDENLKDVPTNVKLIGFVNDEERTALMENCKAFLFPSIYDSFGIPTLEALSNGAKVLSSNSACQEEILGEGAVYYDPYDYEVNLDDLLKKEVCRPKDVLDKYSWKLSGHRLFCLMQEVNDKNMDYK